MQNAHMKAWVESCDCTSGWRFGPCTRCNGSNFRSEGKNKKCDICDGKAFTLTKCDKANCTADPDQAMAAIQKAAASGSGGGGGASAGLRT